MSKTQDSNAVMGAVEQVCGLYRVKMFRIQSRTFTVPGRAGRSRPMFIGQWKDDNGEVHYKGMADLLARPQVPLRILASDDGINKFGEKEVVTVLLWIECKSGKDRLSPEQEAFRHHVTNNGEYHIVVHDDVRPLMIWFEEHGIKQGAFQK